jgi:hypothetical protein
MDFNEQPRQTVGRNFNCDCSVTAEFLTPHDLKLVSRIHCAFVASKDVPPPTLSPVAARDSLNDVASSLDILTKVPSFSWAYAGRVKSDG